MKHSFGFSKYIDYHGIKEQIRTSISTIRAKIEVPEKKVIEQPEISHKVTATSIRAPGHLPPFSSQPK